MGNKFTAEEIDKVADEAILLINTNLPGDFNATAICIAGMMDGCVRAAANFDINLGNEKLRMFMSFLGNAAKMIQQKNSSLPG